MTNIDDEATPADGSPRDFEAFRQALIERERNLPKRLAQVAAFTMANPDEIAFDAGAICACARLPGLL